MAKWKKLLLMMSILCIVNGYSDNLDDPDDDELSYYIRRLNENNQNEYDDPNDMLNYRGQKKQPPKGRNSMFGSHLKEEDEGHCILDKQKLADEKEKLDTCEERLILLESQLEDGKQKLVKLEKKMISEGAVDMKAYYLRSVHHLWNILNLEEAQTILKSEEEALLRRLTVRVTKKHVNSLKEFVNNGININQVDEFLGEAFELDSLPEESVGNTIQRIKEWMYSLMEIGKNVEVWLYMLCGGFILLSVWAIYLFIKDIQHELRWMRVIMMMIVVLFFICCLWHWRHMHKVAESRRHAQMMKRGFTNNIPEECKPGGKGATGSIWEWIKVRAFGAPDVCEKYFEEMMIDPSEEITPAMVIAETLAKFFLQPLQHLGSESAKFITNFYGHIPFAYHIPATIFFIVLVIIFLFAFCGYGIDFPLWMGGIRPIYRTETADTTEVDKITKEAFAQLKNDREKFLSESHKMLQDIAQAAASSQVQAGLQPLMLMSSNIIQSQLENLIAHQFSNVIDQNTDGNIQNTNSSNKVHTITSTPLRTRYKPSTSDDNTDENDGGRLSLCDNKAPSAAASSEKSLDGILAVPDAVHYRLKGTPRQKELPPKNRRNGDSSVSATSSTSDISEHGNASPYREQRRGSSGSVSAVRRRPIRSPNSQSDLPLSPVEPTSNRILNDSRSELCLDDEENSSEDFLNKVKTMLEDSANSSINLDTSLDYSTRNLSRNTSRIEDTSIDEVELSASGTEFLRNIKRVMTP